MPLFLNPKIFKVQPFAGKIMLTVFWGYNQVYFTEYLEKETTVNFVRYTETLKKLKRWVCHVHESMQPFCCSMITFNLTHHTKSIPLLNSWSSRSFNTQRIHPIWHSVTVTSSQTSRET